MVGLILKPRNIFFQCHAQGNNSQIIIRSTVILGEGTRGNVFNLLNQIDPGTFIMIGNRENKKSIAYIGNILRPCRDMYRNRAEVWCL